MNQSKWLVVAAVLLLAACQAPTVQQSGSAEERGFTATADAKPDRERVRVWVIDNQIVVDQEPISFPPGFSGNRVVVRWRLNGDQAYLTFPDDRAIGNFESLPGSPPVIITDPCRIVPQSGGQVIKCEFARDGRKFRFKYTVRVLSNGQELTKLDPTVMID